MTLQPEQAPVLGGHFLGEPWRADVDVAHILMRLLCRDADWNRFVVIEGEPESKQRPRFGRGGKVYSPSAVGESIFRWRLRASFDEPLVGNLAVASVFFRSNRQRIDVDNMLKYVMDAATGVCWHDDSQVTAQAGFVELDEIRPRTLMMIGPHSSTMRRNGPLLKSRNIICQNCGKGFTSEQSVAPKYCSRTCMGEGRQYLKSKVTCGWCQKEFQRRVAAQRFCTDECRLASLVAGTRARGRGPKPCCQLCGKQLTRHGYGLCRSCWKTAR